MLSLFEKQLLKEFGFNDLSNLQAALNQPMRTRYSHYNFRWRLILKSKYQNVKPAVKNLLSKYFVQYENYVLKNQRGTPVNYWPQKAKMQSEYLFDRLVKPWKLTKHRNLLFSIKNPDNKIYFRALDPVEFFKAMDICYKESKQKGAKTKPWKLRLKTSECASSYKGKSNMGAIWVKDDYKIAFLICINIASTWNPQKGDWKPWTFLGSWGTLAREHFNYHLKHGFPLKRGKSALDIATYTGLSAISKNKQITRDVKFQDIANFVFRKGNKGLKQAAFIIGVAFAVGGSTASRIIGSFCDQYNIPKNRLIE